MAGEDRDLVLWALSSLMVAEERTTTKFSGLVGAYGSEEEADEIHAFALNGLNRRLNVIGVELAWIYSASTVARRRTIASRADPWPSPPLTEPFPQTRCGKAVNRCFPGPPAVPVRD